MIDPAPILYAVLTVGITVLILRYRKLALKPSKAPQKPVEKD